MRVALCITGEPRNVRRGIKNIHENMKFEVDVFAHAWWDSDSQKSLFVHPAGDAVSEPVANSWVSELYENFEVKKMLLDKQIKFDVSELLERRKLKFTNSFNVYSSLCSIYKCNELKKDYEIENGFEYDWVIKTRYDFGISEPLDLENLNSDVVYAPNDCNHRYGFNDQFAVGSSKNMDVYSGVFPIIEDVIESHKSGIYTASYCDKPDNMGHEQMVQRQLDNNNVKFELIDFKNFLYRGDKDRTRVISTEPEAIYGPVIREG